MKRKVRILILALLVLGCGKSNLIDEAIKNIANGSYVIFDFFGEGDSVKGVASDFGLKAALPNGTSLEWTFPEDLKGILTIDGNIVEVERPKGLNETFTFTYVIVAPDGSRSSSFPVEVTILGTEVLVSDIRVRSSFSIVKGESRELPNASVLPSNASNKELTWSLSGNNTLYFRISGNSITATGNVGTKGEVTISAADGSGVSKTVEVEIVDTAVTPTRFDVFPKIDHVEVNSEKYIYGYVYPYNYTNGVVSYKITKGGDLASIDSTGKMMTGNKTGTVTVEFSIVADGVTIAPVTSTIHIVPKITREPVNEDVAKKITLLDLDRAFKHQKIVDRVPGSYRGHTSTVMTTSGDIVMALPNGHGAGRILLYQSKDEGKNWSVVNNTPSTWAESKECPTLYPLDCKDDNRRYILTSGIPSNGTGFNWSFSTDGTTWTQFRKHETNHGTTVALADFIQIWDPEKGEFEEKWMGVYHSTAGVNWLVELTFDGNGYGETNVQWTAPRRMFSKADATEIEGEIKACEVGFIRSPDHTTIAALLRNQNHNSQGAYIAFSEDEGKTWSTPVPMPSVLDGERHQGAYFEDGRLIILFREMILRGTSRWYCGELGAWMGTFLDLQKGGLGQYLICLKRDYTPNTNSGDDGYPTLDLLEDGSMYMTSYGTFDTDGTLEWTKNAFGTTSALGETINWETSAAKKASSQNWSPYIMSFSYQASDFDEFATATHTVNSDGSVTPGKVSFDASWRKFPKGPNHKSELPEERCTGNASCTYHLKDSASLIHSIKN